MSSSTVRGEPAWSPVQSLPVANLTSSGLLELDVADGEVQITKKLQIELRADEMLPNPGMGGEWVDRNVNLSVTLTTHRLFLSSSSSSSSNEGTWFLHHSNICQVTQGASAGLMHWKTSPKIILSTYALGNLLLCFRGSGPNDRDDLLQHYQKALARKAWESRTRQEEKLRASTSTGRKVGVDAILAKNAMRHKEAKKLTESAFDGDSETLLKEAAELVTIIQRYTSTLESSGEGKQEEEAQLTDMLSNMGMTSALSKDDYTAANDFYNILARQLADFLTPKLRATGGVMTLTDVYCLFNRARGTNLISPEDLITAAGLLTKLNLSLSMRSFPSGIKVIQLASFNDDKMAARLEKLASAQGSLTSTSVSRELQIPSLLAQEQLLAAERTGRLCRDVTLETTRFYANKFTEYCK